MDSISNLFQIPENDRTKFYSGFAEKMKVKREKILNRLCGEYDEDLTDE